MNFVQGDQYDDGYGYSDDYGMFSGRGNSRLTGLNIPGSSAYAGGYPRGRGQFADTSSSSPPFDYKTLPPRSMSYPQAATFGSFPGTMSPIFPAQLASSGLFQPPTTQLGSSQTSFGSSIPYKIPSSPLFGSQTSTTSTTAPGSCKNSCGSQSKDGCWCDLDCATNGICAAHQVNET